MQQQPNSFQNRPSANQFKGDHQSKPPEQTLEKLWPAYLKDGYFDQDGHLRVDLVSRQAIDPLVKAMSEAQPALTMHQLRRFFQHCRGMETRLKSNASDWNSEVSAFKKLDIAAADAFGKSSKKIPRLFHDFIQRNVAAVNTKKDFLKGFLPHFEALVGFGAQYLREKEQR